MTDRGISKKKEGFRGQKAIVLPRKILTERCANNEIIGALYITDIGYYPKASHHYRERIHGADQEILIYCQEGKGTITRNRKTDEIEAGDFFVIPARKAHVYMASEQNPWTIYWMHFTGKISSRIVSAIEENNGAKGFLKNSNQAISLFNEMYAQLERGYGSDNLMYVNMCLWHFFTTFIFNEKYDTSKSINSKDEINRAIDFMRKNINNTVKVGDIAQAANLSTTYFANLFKSRTGFSPIEYFNHLKVQQACQYLLFTNFRVKEISYELGIDDPYYFSRMFAKVMGMSPNTYRKKRIH